MKFMIRATTAAQEPQRVSERITTAFASLLRRLLAMSLLLALIGLPATAASEELTIVVAHKILSLPIYVAESQGYFAAEGVKVTLKEESSGNRAMQLLLDGKADLVTAAETVIMFHSFKSNDFAVIATLATSTKVVDFIVGKDLGSARPEQLAGKRIGTVVGTASDYYLDSWLVFHGVDPTTTRLVGLQPETMAAALEKGEVDAVAIWDPFGYEILKTVPGARMLPNPGIYNLSFNLIAGQKFLGPRVDEFASVLRALLSAERFIQAEPVKAQAILRKHLKQDQDLIDGTWSHQKFRISLEKSLITTLESEARWARQVGHVSASRSPNYLNFINSEPLRKAQPDRVGTGR